MTEAELTFKTFQREQRIDWDGTKFRAEYEQQYIDLLPPEVREFVNFCPIPQADWQKVYLAWRRWGTEKLLEVLRSELKKRGSQTNLE